MQVKSFISSALLLGVVAFSPAINTQEVAAKPSPKKPYCTIASKKGAFWWTWTQSTIKQSCKTARDKVKATGQKKVIGSGSSVFENGINMASKLKWNGCTLRITN